MSGPGFAEPIVICNGDYRFAVEQQMDAIGVRRRRIVLEPESRNTAPAVTVAALLADDPEAILMAAPADHIVRDHAAFERATQTAARAAVEGFLVTFGVRPTIADTGRGYIRRGAAIGALDGTFAVSLFVEKPDRARAEEFVKDGGYFWNSGIFCFTPKTLLAEMTRFEPGIVTACRAAVERMTSNGDVGALERTAFAASPSQSLDYGVMEHTDNAVIVPVDMGWDDVGSWDSLWQSGVRDAHGNGISGDVVAVNVKNSYLSSSGPLLAATNIEDIVVVATDDAVLVTQREKSQDIRELVAKLKATNRHEYAAHSKTARPWGWFETIDRGPGFQVKRIVVDPGAKLSLQLHHRRSEHWVVVSGEANVTVGERVFALRERETTFIPAETRHRLENPGTEALHLIEVQFGAYLGEDDIVRFEDVYGRA
jgi:mannose-1-phosphate guanylyltransferase/mannose-6-phosphate isomerase